MNTQVYFTFQNGTSPSTRPGLSMKSTHANSRVFEGATSTFKHSSMPVFTWTTVQKVNTTIYCDITTAEYQFAELKNRIYILKTYQLWIAGEKDCFSKGEEWKTCSSLHSPSKPLKRAVFVSSFFRKGIEPFKVSRRFPEVTELF